VTARTAFIILTAACTALTIVRGRVDGITVLAAVFATLAALTPRKQKAER
jgi:hypothetical protein